MRTAPERRIALADFLKHRRAQVVRRELGLPPGGRGKEVGLRREEVSYLSGVGITWYTWLEQARDIQPSREVLEAIGRTLRLPRQERSYVLELAGYASMAGETHAHLGQAPSTVQRLLDALDPNPAYAIFHDWTISGWNTAYQALYPNVATADPDARNLLWLIFTDPDVRELLPDWPTASRRFLAQFRAEVGPYLEDPGVVDLIARLTRESEDFRSGWDSHDVELFNSRYRTFHHPRAGDLTLEHHRVAPSDHPDLHLVIYTPASPASAAALRLM